ncbi:MAG: ATP-binding cassette domain-containing protein [Fretibacterium sp.]|nr:ATP-binding cassette domain-containing protein [Fretibacterium sp.]
MSLSVSISKSFGPGGFHLDAHFEAQDGILALLGASGCGKSLTLKCIAGIETPDSGRIVLDGRVLFDSERRVNLTPQERRVGYLFQQYALFPNMTVAQNIAAGLKGGGRKRSAEAVADYVRRLHLSGLEGLRPHQLSGGQQQRVALARILASKPHAILLDEPFSALDSYLRWQLEMELADLLATFQGTVLWVSHDRDEIYRNCADVCVMDRGRCDPVTPTAELFRRPQTLGAARLVGLKNLFKAQSAREGGLFLPELGAVLPAPALEEGVTHVGIDARTLRPAAPDEPGLTCRVVRITEEKEHTIYMLEPENVRSPASASTSASVKLRMEQPREARLPAPSAKGELLRVSVDPGDILPLRS